LSGVLLRYLFLAMMYLLTIHHHSRILWPKNECNSAERHLPLKMDACMLLCCVFVPSGAAGCPKPMSLGSRNTEFVPLTLADESVELTKPEQDELTVEGSVKVHEDFVFPNREPKLLRFSWRFLFATLPMFSGLCFLRGAFQMRCRLRMPLCLTRSGEGKVWDWARRPPQRSIWNWRVFLGL